METLEFDITFADHACIFKYSDRYMMCVYIYIYTNVHTSFHFLYFSALMIFPSLSQQDWEGATAVHLGIKGGHADVCRFLMEQKADLQEALDFGSSVANFSWGFP